MVNKFILTDYHQKERRIVHTVSIKNSKLAKTKEKRGYTLQIQTTVSKIASKLSGSPNFNRNVTPLPYLRF